VVIYVANLKSVRVASLLPKIGKATYNCTVHLHLPGYVRLRNYSKTSAQRLSMPRFQNDMARKDGDKVVSQSRGRTFLNESTD